MIPIFRVSFRYRGSADLLIKLYEGEKILKAGLRGQLRDGYKVVERIDLIAADPIDVTGTYSP